MISVVHRGRDRWRPSPLSVVGARLVALTASACSGGGSELSSASIPDASDETRAPTDASATDGGTGASADARAEAGTPDSSSDAGDGTGTFPGGGQCSRYPKGDADCAARGAPPVALRADFVSDGCQV
jgi:hypothetical protein